MNMPDRLAAALADRYRLERPIGEGGMATVYLAHDIRHGRAVAIKVLRPELAAVIGAERFITEIRTTANLHHPNILPLFDSGEADGFLYYVMPQVQGESLRQRLDRDRQLPVEDAVRIAREVAGALDYAHRHGVIHRDVKPANILLQDGRPLVADFGIALALSAAGGSRLTESGMSIGTPHYMSPEQASAERSLTPRSDVYSLACVLYEMLAGDPPHTGPTPQAILMRILTEKPKPVTDARHTVPLELADVLARALEKLPADRFESAAAFEKALSDVPLHHGRRTDSQVSQETVAFRRAAPRQWFRDRRSLAALGVFVALAAAFGFTAGMLLRRPSQPTPFPVRLNLDVGSLNAGSFDISPDGRTIAMSASMGDDSSSLWVRAAEDAEFRRIPLTEGADEVSFSPDGQQILYTRSNDGSLRSVPLFGGAPLTVLPEGAVSNPRMIHWGDDGTIVLAGSGGLYRVGKSGAPELILRFNDARVPGDAETIFLFQPRLLPGGAGVLFSVNQVDSAGTVARSVRLLDLSTGSVRVLVSEGWDARYVETGHLLFVHPEGGLFAVPFDLRRLEVTGQPVQMADAVGPYDYAVTSTGTLLYRTAHNSLPTAERLLVIRLSTSAEDTLPLPRTDISSVRWSPDGRSIAYVTGDPPDRNIFIYEMDQPVRQLTFQGDNISPVWSPDGTRIAFGSTRLGTDGMDLFVKALDDTPEVQILNRPGGQWPAAWPERDLLVVASPTDEVELQLLKPEPGAEPRPYLSSSLTDIAVAPERGLAAYEAPGEGPGARLVDVSSIGVYVRNFPEPKDAAPVSEFVGLGMYPRWSPDGKTIYYWRRSLATDTLYAADVQRDPAFRVHSRRAVAWGDGLNVQSWDLHPAGDTFIVPQNVNTARPDEPAPEPSFFVVINWFEELKARLDSGR